MNTDKNDQNSLSKTGKEYSEPVKPTDSANKISTSMSDDRVVHDSGSINRTVTGGSALENEAEEDIFIGYGSALTGDFFTQRSILVDGSIDNATLNCKHFSLSRSGFVIGSAVSETAEISGKFSGELHCSSDLVLRSSAVVDGNVTCRSVTIHRGARLKGNVSVEGRDLNFSSSLHGRKLPEAALMVTRSRAKTFLVPVKFAAVLIAVGLLVFGYFQVFGDL